MNITSSGFIDAANSTATSLIKGNVIYIESTAPTYAYTAAVYYTNGDGGPKTFEENHFELKAQSGGFGHLLYVDSTTDNVVIDTFSNFGDVTGFASNYIAYIGAGDEFNSVFNRVHADAGHYGPGNVNVTPDQHRETCTLSLLVVLGRKSISHLAAA